MAAMSRFSFVGTPVIPKSEAKRPFCNEFQGAKNTNQHMITMNFGIKESENNMAFVEGFGMASDSIYTMNTDNEKIEISWSNRFDEAVVKSVANYKKFTVDLGDEFGGRKEFISQYDAIQHLKQWLPKYKGKTVITGQFVKEWYKDQYYDKFKFQNIYAADDDTKNRLALTMEVFYNKDSVDKTDFKDNKKIYLNGFISQYINKDEETKYIPQQFVFNASKYDLENNDRHKTLFNYKMRYIDIKNKTMAHMLWDIVLVRGAEEVDFDESMLTAAQKEQIELGVRTIDDFKPRGNIYGGNINEYRLFEPKLLGDFADGILDTDLKISEFEEQIYIPVKEETVSDMMKDEEEDDLPFDADDMENDDEDLF